MTNLQQKCKCK